MSGLISTVAIGVGATAVMDLWSVARKGLLGSKMPDYGMVGRWFGHMRHGQFKHMAISKSPRIKGELVLGWTAHYVIGIAFAALLTVVWDQRWAEAPTLAPAVMVGVGTVIAPYFLMQPAMGAGIAAAKSPNPNAARLQSFLNHLVFGLGLYLAALMAQPLASV